MLEISKNLQDNGSGVFNPVATGVSATITSGTINYITGAIVLNMKGGITVSNVEFQYETYDVDAVAVNIDIKYNQMIRYNKSLINVETV